VTVIFELISALSILAIGVVFMVQSLLLNQQSDFTFLEGPAVFPFVFAAVVTILSLVFLFQVVVQKRQELREAFGKVKPTLAASKHDLIKLAVIVVATVVYIVILMPWLRFPISTFIYLTVCTIFFGKIKPLYAVIISALFSAGVYYFFLKVLSIYLP